MHNRPSVAVGAWADVARAKRVHAASTRPGGHPALEELHGAREAPVAALHPRRHQPARAARPDPAHPARQRAALRRVEGPAGDSWLAPGSADDRGRRGNRSRRRTWPPSSPPATAAPNGVVAALLHRRLVVEFRGGADGASATAATRRRGPTATRSSSPARNKRASAVEHSRRVRPDDGSRPWNCCPTPTALASCWPAAKCAACTRTARPELARPGWGPVRGLPHCVVAVERRGAASLRAL